PSAAKFRPKMCVFRSDRHHIMDRSYIQYPMAIIADVPAPLKDWSGLAAGSEFLPESRTRRGCGTRLRIYVDKPAVGNILSCTKAGTIYSISRPQYRLGQARPSPRAAGAVRIVPGRSPSPPEVLIRTRESAPWPVRSKATHPTRIPRDHPTSMNRNW